MLDLSKPTWTKVNEAIVHDGEGGGQIVRVGDQVELVAPTDNEYVVKNLGPGPYVITLIGQWRCSKKSLYLKTTNKDDKRESNDKADKFKIH